MLTDKIVSITKNCLIVSEKIGNFCVKIRETLEAEIVGLWGCNTLYDNIPNTSITHLGSFLVLIHFGRVSIIVFKIYDKVCFSDFCSNFIIYIKFVYLLTSLTFQSWVHSLNQEN